MELEKIMDTVGLSLGIGLLGAVIYLGATAQRPVQNSILRDVNNDGKAEMLCKIPELGWFEGMIENNRKPTWLDAVFSYMGKEMPGRDYDILDRMDGVDPATRELDLFVQSISSEKCGIGDKESSHIFNLTPEGRFLDTGLQAKRGIVGIYSGATISTFFSDKEGDFIANFP